MRDNSCTVQQVKDLDVRDIGILRNSPFRKNLKNAVLVVLQTEEVASQLEFIRGQLISGKRTALLARFPKSKIELQKQISTTAIDIIIKLRK